MNKEVRNKKLWFSGQSLPEVLTSMLLLGILMMVAYTAMQRGMGLASPVQQEAHAALLREAEWDDFAPGVLEQEVNGRTLRRIIIRLGDSEPIFEVKLQCFAGERLLTEQNRIIRK